LWGGDGTDYLYAYAYSLGDNANDLAAEKLLPGDELHGGAGNDWLYGNIRSEILIGDGGNDTIYGDWLEGRNYALNQNAATVGGNDLLYGGAG
jgi:Ca2+-binding RTX toxin-like protein